MTRRADQTRHPPLPWGEDTGARPLAADAEVGEGRVLAGEVTPLTKLAYASPSAQQASLSSPMGEGGVMLLHRG